MNLSDAIETNARRRPDHPAVVRRDGGIITYREYGDSVQCWAAVLAADGLGPGDIVGVNLKDTPDHLVALYAIARAGAAILPMDWRWTIEEKSRIAGFFGARAVLSEPDDPFLDSAGSWVGMPIDEAWQQRVAAVGPMGDIPEAEDPDLVLALSSGTTGTPKGPMITHGQFLARFLIYLISIGFSERDRYLCATPLYFGGCRGYSMCTLYAGGTILMHPPPYESADLLSYANEHQATRLFLVPTLLRRLMTLEGGTPGAPLFESLELLYSTGAVLHAEERDELMQRFCSRYLNFYGSTDGGGCSALMWDDAPEFAASVGRPVFGATLDIVDEADQPAPLGEVGRIRYRHPGTASGYYNDVAASLTAFRDGWYYPGDLGWVDKDGYLFLAGRETDMIIRGGANIYPAEIEHILTLHPDVHEAAVIGWPSREFGEEIAAFIVPVSHKGALDSEGLIAYCREKLAPYKIPRAIFAIEALPKSGVGKILKTELAGRLAKIE
ncbi:MAG: acyl--CoA ligase [Rhodospirillaceae bacterium]|jgi:long-chain acyl-CoA synthetase|nr:acyl--CoA ligase [Rhodospirillaceae bacterium]MBT5457848.1 acyl--CoA ligase [Rhodospirillaceae bacterium]